MFHLWFSHSLNMNYSSSTPSQLRLTRPDAAIVHNKTTQAKCHYCRPADNASHCGISWLCTNQLLQMIYHALPSKAQNSSTLIDITTLVDRKQRCTTWHAILVKKRMILPSLLQSISAWLCQVCEMTFFLKTFLRNMMTCAEIDYRLHFWLCHII